MNTFPHPSIPLHSSTNRSQHAFVSALLLPFFPSPLERANTFSLCQCLPLLPVCVRVHKHLDVWTWPCAAGSLWSCLPLLEHFAALLCGCRVVGYLSSWSVEGWTTLFKLTWSGIAWQHYLRFALLESPAASSAGFGWCLSNMLGWCVDCIPSALAQMWSHGGIWSGKLPVLCFEANYIFIW